MVQTVQTHNIAKAPVANNKSQASNKAQSAPTNNAFSSLPSLGMPGSQSSMMAMLAMITQLIQKSQGGNSQNTVSNDVQRPTAQGSAPTPAPAPERANGNSRGGGRPVRPGPAPAPINNGPTANNDRATTTSGTPITLNVLANDTDPDRRDTLSVVSFANPTNGTVRQEGNRLIYTPNAGFAGNDAFTYTMSDGRGGTSSATAAVTVRSSLGNARRVGTEDTPLRLAWGDFNLPAGSDGVKLSTLPADGKLTLNNQPVRAGQVISHSDFATGQLIFKPDANESGTDAYQKPGVGNRKSDYAKIEFAATKGGAVISNSADFTIDIKPVAESGATLTKSIIAVHATYGETYSPPAATGLTVTSKNDPWGTWTGRPGEVRHIRMIYTGVTPPPGRDSDGSEVYKVAIADKSGYDDPVFITGTGEVLVPDEDGRVWADAGAPIWHFSSAGGIFEVQPYAQEVNSEGQVLSQKGGPIGKRSTPLILDLNGDGVKTVGIDNGNSFALNPEENSTHGWVDENDGLLVLDLDKDGTINNGTELFGDSTVLADGTTAKDGFEALTQYDTNNDGQINKLDGVFEKLQVWTDKNGDGISQADELRSLDETGVASLGLKAEETDIHQNGNTIGLQGSFTKTDGTKAEFSDVWFHTEIQADDA